MGRGLQTLIAAACVAVIAFVFYFFVQERQDAKVEADRRALENHRALVNEIERRYSRRP